MTACPWSQQSILDEGFRLSQQCCERHAQTRCLSLQLFAFADAHPMSEYSTTCLARSIFRELSNSIQCEAREHHLSIAQLCHINFTTCMFFAIGSIRHAQMNTVVQHHSHPNNHPNRHHHYYYCNCSIILMTQ